MSGEVSTLLNAVKSTIKDWLPALKSVEIHGGRFSLADVKKYSTRTPAVFVTALNIPPREIGSQDVDAPVDLMLFIITKDAPGLSRYESALAIAEHIAERLPGKNLGLSFAFPAEQVQAKNLHTTELANIGVTLWGVAWKQTLRFSRNTSTDPLCRYLYIDGPAPIEAGELPE